MYIGKVLGLLSTLQSIHKLYLRLINFKNSNVKFMRRQVNDSLHMLTKIDNTSALSVDCIRNILIN